MPELESDATSELQAPHSLDVGSCDREPIHIPGSIQPHGFLLALDDSGRIAADSANAAQYFAAAPERMFRATLSELFGPATARGLQAALAAETLTAATRLLPTVHLGTDTFETVAHLAPSERGPLTILEFEQTHEPADPEALNARLYNIVGPLRRFDTIEEICRDAADELGALTGCDRVVLYRFNSQGDGEVLSEALRGDAFSSYLGLRFPASDVPTQARRMYLLNRVRIIPDVDYRPSPLVGPQGPAPEIDLSSSVLRSVSPIHREYMRNMGTVCSMSVSIVIDGRLWGLVSCHHPRPRFLSLRLRSACDFLMQIVASEIESHEKSSRLERALAARSTAGRLLSSMAAQTNRDRYLDGLTRVPALLQQLTDSDGAAVIAGERAQLFGHTPSEPETLRLVEWLAKEKPDELFATDRLPLLYPPAADFAAEASGVLAIPISRLRNTHILWFRRELVQTVRWAGHPHKPAETAVSPRRSFEEWKETVRHTARPWVSEEIEAAREFRAAMLEIVLSRAEELAVLAHDLQTANQELEAFSYSVSHDLRAPFRHISGFAEMLRDEEADRLTDRGRRYLATILDSAGFAGRLVDSLLDFSRFARATIEMAPVDMEQLVDDEWRSVLGDETRGRSTQYRFSRGPLPHVLGSRELLRQVVRNLLSNAAKYTGKQEAATIRVQAETVGREIVFSVQDNGVGFDSRFAGKLFGVFQRLHRIEEFEGTGIGLANVRRIVQRHGGRTWGQGETGKGATFFFSLPRTVPPELA